MPAQSISSKTPSANWCAKPFRTPWTHTKTACPPVIVDIYECDIAAEHIGATSLKPHLERALARTITTGQLTGKRLPESTGPSRESDHPVLGHRRPKHYRSARPEVGQLNLRRRHSGERRPRLTRRFFRHRQKRPLQRSRPSHRHLLHTLYQRSARKGRKDDRARPTGQSREPA